MPKKIKGCPHQNKEIGARGAGWYINIEKKKEMNHKTNIMEASYKHLKIDKSHKLHYVRSHYQISICLWLYMKTWKPHWYAEWNA